MNKKWLVLLVICCMSGIFAYRYFNIAIPIVSVNVTMDKSQAQAKAYEIANKYNWNVSGYDSCVYFDQDSQLEAFVDLEGGGKQAFLDMIKNDLYQPYIWQVRLYKEKEVKEVIVKFTPDGKPYGFAEILSENEPGVTIQREQAQSLIGDMVADWDIDLTPYVLVEYNTQTALSGRVDHVFVYERNDISLGKGLYRIRAVISGDKVSLLNREIKIPDEFCRRYTQMRSVNVLINSIFTIVLFVGYLFILGIFLLFFLYSRRYFLLQKSIVLTGIAFLLIFIWQFNDFPLSWKCYSTTTSKMLFIVMRLVNIFTSSLMMAVLIGIICFLAEAANRYVFKNHIQFFKLWFPAVAASHSVLQQTVLGYMIAIIKLGYLVAFSFIVQKWGWWMPLSSLVDPNILSTYVPFVSPLIMALYAGFNEEFWCRVLPISGVLLFAKDTKYEKYIFWIIMIFQAVVFGGVHAGYPQQPAYYRIVEMLIPFTIYGLIYVRIGMLPIIIGHVMYDAFLMSLPIFLSHLWLHKVFVVIGMGIPLWVVLYAYIRQKGFKGVADEFYNKAWQPSVVSDDKSELYVREFGQPINSKINYALYVFGIIGLVLIYIAKPWKFDIAPFAYSKSEILNQADKILYEKYGDIGSGWTRMILLEKNNNDSGNKFIMQTYGEQAYKKLQDSYIVSPLYRIRYAKFYGTLEERAEEYNIFIAGDGSVFNMVHTKAQVAPGADLDEVHALDIAYKALQDNYGLLKDDVVLVSCNTIKHEHRRDWDIVFKDNVYYTYASGQARINLKLMGDEVSSLARYVYPTEEWTRENREKTSFWALFTWGQSMLRILLFFLVFFLGLPRIGIKYHYIKKIGFYIIALCFYYLVFIVNEWNLISFNTAQTYLSQLCMKGLFSGMTSIFIAALNGILLVLIIVLNRRAKFLDAKLFSVGMFCTALGIVGLEKFFMSYMPLLQAKLPLYFVNYHVPSLVIVQGYFFNNILEVVKLIGALLFLTNILYERYKSIAVPISLFIIFEFTVLDFDRIQQWDQIIAYILLFGSLKFLLSWCVFRQNFELLLLFCAFYYAINLVFSMYFVAYPGIIFDGLCSIVCIAIGLYFLVKRLQKA